MRVVIYDPGVTYNTRHKNNTDVSTTQPRLVALQPATTKRDYKMTEKNHLHTFYIAEYIVELYNNLKL